MKNKTIILTLLIMAATFFAGCEAQDQADNPFEVEPVPASNNQEESSPSELEEAKERLNQEINKDNNDSEMPTSQKQPPKAPQADAQLLKQYSGAIIKTNLGDIEVIFHSQDSPQTVTNFMTLTQKDFYDGTKFHRVIPNFMIQGGDPNSKDDNWADDGTGGPGYQFSDEFNSHKLVKGSLAMANSGPDTNGSQFFIVTADATSWLDGKHTNFGQVTEGMDVVSQIEKVQTNAQNHPTEDVVIEDIELFE